MQAPQREPSSGRGNQKAGPMVRIRFPPAASPFSTVTRNCWRPGPIIPMARADARTAKCEGFVQAVNHYDAIGATGEGDGRRREGAEDVDYKCCADRGGRAAGQAH